jgi:CcmD family protein
MMLTKLRNLLLFILILNSDSAFSQSADVEMADKLRESGMIYIVVGVLLIVITGLLIYLISVDRKVSDLEKEIKRK